MADLIACEDTRHSIKFLSAFDIKKPLVSYHKFNERESGEKIITLLKEGKTVAVITDAGMPVISDPGNVLVKMLIEEELPFTVIPGVSAFTAGLVLCGLDASRFCFIGFLPEKNKDFKELISQYKTVKDTLIFYAAPHDLKDHVERLFEELGNRKAVAVREITKLHEEREEFYLKDGYPKEPKGEYVLYVEGATEYINPLNELSVEEHIAYYIEKGMDKKSALKEAAKDRGVPKNTLYKYTINN